mmetsp:Transcript_1851/g.5527  ORF Transcript_1851/g.5527 Transcript_1851/m.5527 type:complete len:240 (-) Transcript_1851:207-926(-)
MRRRRPRRQLHLRRLLAQEAQPVRLVRAEGGRVPSRPAPDRHGRGHFEVWPHLADVLFGDWVQHVEPGRFGRLADDEVLDDATAFGLLFQQRLLLQEHLGDLNAGHALVGVVPASKQIPKAAIARRANAVARSAGRRGARRAALQALAPLLIVLFLRLLLLDRLFLLVLVRRVSSDAHQQAAQLQAAEPPGVGAALEKRSAPLVVELNVVLCQLPHLLDAHSECVFQCLDRGRPAHALR